MNNFKKTIQIATILLVAFIFTACGTDPSTTSNVTTYSQGETATLSSTDKYKALTSDTNITMVIDPLTLITQVTVNSGAIEVTRN